MRNPSSEEWRGRGDVGVDVEEGVGSNNVAVGTADVRLGSAVAIAVGTGVATPQADS